MKPPLSTLVLFTACVAWGQSAAPRPEFDVASLKPVVLDGAPTYSANLGSFRNGSLAMTNTTLAECIRFAYDITSDDLLAGPDWIKSKEVRFDILAKTSPETPRSQALMMLRSLLEGRFQLVLRREPRTLSYYALTAPNGPGKLIPAKEPPPDGGVSLRPGRLVHNHMTMLLLATLIARFTRLPVVDQTALPEFFDVKLEWAWENPQPAPNAPPVEAPDGPSLTEAVQKQLGLKLEKRKGPVDVLVVDHAEKTPRAN